MSAEVEAAEMTVRLITSAGESVLRIAPTAATTIIGLTRQLLVFGHAHLIGGPAARIMNDPSGPALLSVSDENYKLLEENLKKLGIKCASVDLTPLDGWTDFIVPNANFQTAQSIIDRLQIQYFQRGFEDLHEEVLPEFWSWADNLSSEKDTFDNMINRRTDNLNTARNTPYVLCDRLHPENYIIIKPEITQDEKGKDYVKSTYELYKDGIKVNELTDAKEHTSERGSWQSMKETMLLETSINKDDVIYFNKPQDLERYILSYNEAIAPTPSNLMGPSEIVEPEKMAQDPAYKEKVEKSVEHQLKRFIEKIKAVQIENPTLAHSPENQGLESGQNISKEETLEEVSKGNKNKSENVLGLRAWADQLRSESPMVAVLNNHNELEAGVHAELENYKNSLHDGLITKTQQEVIDAYEDLASSYKTVRENYTEINDMMAKGIDSIADSEDKLDTLSRLEEMSVRKQNENDIVNNVITAQRDYINALKNGDEARVKVTKSKVDYEKGVLNMFKNNSSLTVEEAYRDFALKSIRARFSPERGQ